MPKTFIGGVHPKDEKELTKDKPIRPAKDPKTAIIHLCQHTGATCTPLVKVGDYVKVGQKIGDSEARISAPVHSSISGKVIAIEERPHPAGINVPAIVIESDGQNLIDESIKPYPPLESLSPDNIRAAVREAGIVGLGGAVFPTHVKLQPPKDKPIKSVILNGCECEPMITCDYRLMIENPQEILFGMKAIMKAVAAEEGFIGIENNKPDAIKIMKEVTKSKSNIKVIEVKTKYPQGGEKQLIKVILNLEVPSGGLPYDVHVLVQNVGTAVAIANTLLKGMPLIERIVTVTGKYLKNPSNLKVKIGTPFSQLTEECGGTEGKIKKLIMGGPMMGIAQIGLEVGVAKCVTSLIVQTEEEVLDYKSEPCIRCAKCVDVCPAFILPAIIASYAENGMFNLSKEYGALDCIECGACAYVCPSRIELVQLIKLAKYEVSKK